MKYASSTIDMKTMPGLEEVVIIGENKNRDVLEQWSDGPLNTRFNEYLLRLGYRNFPVTDFDNFLIITKLNFTAFIVL